MKLKRAVKAPPPETTVVEEPQSEASFEVIGIRYDTIQKLLRKSYEIANDSQDYTLRKVRNHNLSFTTDMDSTYTVKDAGLTFVTDDGGSHVSGLSRYAFGQLCNKIGVPALYIEKCITTGRGNLAQRNMNSWIESYGKDLFLREYDGSIRGVLSSKYSVCDSHEILEVVDSEVDLSKYRVKGSFLNEERLHVRLVSKEMLPIDGEDLFAGLFVDSSDVGRSILTVQFGIYKQVCTNGLIVARAGGVLFQQKHIGITADEFRSGLSASLKNVDKLVDNAADWVSYAKNQKAYGYNFKSMSKKDTEEFLERVRVRAKVSEEGAKKVLDLMNTKYGDSQWGLINSITELAQDYTLEKRLELERYAGNLLVA